MTPTDEQVEAVARAIYETASGPWGHASYYAQEIVRREARAAIAALQPQDGQAARIIVLESRQRVLLKALEHLIADLEAAHVSGALSNPPPSEHEMANLRRARRALAGDAG